MKTMQRFLAFFLAIFLSAVIFAVPTSAAAQTFSGDITGDKTVNVSDLIRLKKNLLSAVPFNYDLNGDNVTTSTDVVLLRALLLGRYAVVYRVFADEYRIDYYAEGETVVPPPVPVVNSYSFDNWDGIPAVASDCITVVRGVFTNSYEFPIIK